MSVSRRDSVPSTSNAATPNRCEDVESCPGATLLLRLGDELAKLARPRHQLLAAAVADRIGVQSEEGVAYAVDRLHDLPFHVRAGVDALALALATAGPERAIEAADTLPLPFVGMYPKLVRSLILFAEYERVPVGAS